MAVSRRKICSRFAGSLLLIFFLAATSSVAGSDKAIVLNAGVLRPYTTDRGDGFLDQVIKEAFRRAGSSARVQVYAASERAMINANSGVDDGFAMRIAGLEQQYPNLVRVPEKVIDNDFVAYSLLHNVSVGGWDGLRPYHVAYILGWKVFENNLPADIAVTKVKDAGQLFSLLALGRTEVILYERWQGLWQARNLGLSVRMQEPPLAKSEMFIYLHKKHAHLVERVAGALADMKRDGTYRRIFDSTLSPLSTGG